MRKSLWALTALVAMSLALPAPAGAVTTFGADLSVAPNVEIDCRVNPANPELFPVLTSGAETCTWWTTGRINDTSQGDIVPWGGGTIVRARVRVGPVTGPMQFVVMRSLRHPENLGEPGCCFPVGASEVFTPAPNSVTTVPMNVAARHERDPATGIENYDNIAISVLAPEVPLPAYDTGDRSLNAPAGGGFYPAYEPGTERTTGLFSVVGYQTLINADIEPYAEPPPPTPNPGPVDISGLIKLGKSVRVRGNRAYVPLVCTSEQECAGLLRLGSVPQRGKARLSAAHSKKGARAVTYGKARFKLAAGKHGKVRVRLTGAGKGLLRKRKRAKALAVVKMGGEQLKKRLTLRR